MINIFKTPMAMVIRKYSPEILTGLGIVGFIGSTIMACKATAEVGEVLDEHKEEMNSIKDLQDNYDYEKKEIVKEKTNVFVRTSTKMVKLYAPAVGLGVFGTTCVLGGHGILRKRNAAISAAYAFLSNKFKDYRGQVKEELGEAKDREFYHGIKMEKITFEEVNEDGKKKKVTQEVAILDPTNGMSKYAKVFNSDSTKWQSDRSYNRAFLMNMQQWFNDRLKTQGHVFLNEVYDALGIPRTKEGTVVGWVYQDDPTYGDNYIDFGIYNLVNQDTINGYSDEYFLDFNVDGLIWDLI